MKALLLFLLLSFPFVGNLWAHPFTMGPNQCHYNSYYKSYHWHLWDDVGGSLRDTTIVGGPCYKGLIRHQALPQRKIPPDIMEKEDYRGERKSNTCK